MNYDHEATKIGALIAQAPVAAPLAKLEDIERDIAGEQAAFHRAETRRDELTAEMRAATAKDPEGDALAEQFRTGVAIAPKRTVDAIATDQQSTIAAMTSIRRRIEDLQAERAEARRNIAHAIGQTLARPEDALSARIDAAYAELVACHVDAVAMADAFAAPVIRQKRLGLHQVIEALQKAERGFYKSQHTPSAGLIGAMDQHSELLRKADLRRTDTVTLRF